MSRRGRCTYAVRPPRVKPRNNPPTRCRGRRSPMNTRPGPRDSSTEIAVLFVCLGNICRSPLAEGVFRGLVEEAGLAHRFRVDSAGTGSWHLGDPPDSRSVAVATHNGVRLAGRARRVDVGDLDDFDWILAMDRSNHRSIEGLSRGDAPARIHLLRDFDPDGGDTDVPDPYYGGSGGFQEVFDIVDRSCRALLDHILNEDG